MSELENEPRLDWSTADVRDGKLTVTIEGEQPKGWKQSFETVAHLLAHGSPVKLKKSEARVDELQPGDEEKVRHLLESIVQQANADHRPPEDEQSDDEEDDDEVVVDLGESRPDREMGDRFRSFGDQSESA